MERERPRVELSHPHCPYCKDDVRPEENKEACHACMAWHHADCWETHGGCSACSTAIAPTVGPRSDVRPTCFRRDCNEPLHETQLPADYRVDHGGERVHMGRLCAKHATAGLEGYALTIVGMGAVCLALAIFTGVLAVISRRWEPLLGAAIFGASAALCSAANARYRGLVRTIAGPQVAPEER